MLEDGQFTGQYFLTDLSGVKRRSVSFGKGKFWPVIYIDSLDAIVLQERTANRLKGEWHPVHIYEFVEGSKIKISESALLSRSVVYIKN